MIASSSKASRRRSDGGWGKDAGPRDRMVSSRAPMPEASAAQQAVIARELEALGALGTKRVEAAE
jgi:hypothetical protein